MGLGGFPGTHPLSLGMLGMHGTFYANRAVTAADLVIAVGARFDDRVTGRTDGFAPRARVIHIDIDPTSIGKNVACDLAIVGDAKDILRRLTGRIKKTDSSAAWRRAISSWKRKHPLTYDRGPGKIKPQYVIEEIYRLTKGNAIIATEVGQNQMWATQWYLYDRPRTFISSGGLGTMGFGLPAAIGAKIGRPDRTVFNIAGDGSIQMNIQELATCVSYGIDIKVAILNNGCLGMVRQWQELFYRKRYSQTMLANPDFVKIAEGYGCRGIRVEEKRGVPAALAAALAEERPVFIDFRIDPGENVLPMVPAGEPLDTMIEYDDRFLSKEA
jgi:acetolactate synthase-1/2/3 large subunit